MPKATDTLITPAPSRRNLLAVAPLAAVAAALPAAALGQVQTDQELIRICDEHIRNLAALNASKFPGDDEDDPAWQAYEKTHDAIFDAKPVTLAGMAAKARAAKAEARQRDGSEDFNHCSAGQWAWDLMHDMLRLHGQA